MWVKTLTKTFRLGSAVQPLFWRAIFLTQCFSPLLLQLKLIHIYLNISVPLLKILKTHISPLISSLINDSFLCGIFPSKLKWAKVIPVFKKGSRQDKDNYRLISVLSTFSKIFEKAVFKRLYGYLESRNILYPLQFGFRQKCSTNHALIQITESIRNSIDNNEFGCGIFNYLKKSFDTVNHCILLSKLNHYGVRGKAYDWFQSYLSNREQFVCINGQLRDPFFFVLSVTLVQNFGILYLLKLRKSSRFPVFVNISRILWLMVIILLLIPNVLRLYYL